MFTSFSIACFVAFSQVPERLHVPRAPPFSGAAHRVALERLVRASDVVAALEVDDETKANLRLLSAERDEQAERVGRLIELKPGAERTGLLAEIVAEPAASPSKVVSTLKEILGERKFERLRQIQRQLLGPAAVIEAGDDLGLTREQRDRILEISRAGGSKSLDDEKLPVDSRREQLTQVRQALTADQQRKLDEMMGPASGVVSSELNYNREFGRRNSPMSFWQASHFAPVVYLGVPEVRRWLGLANWTEIENLMVEENDIEALLAFTVDRLSAADAEALAHRALMARKKRMFKLQDAVYPLMSAYQVTRLKNLKYQANKAAPYSWPTMDLLGVTKVQSDEYSNAFQREVMDQFPKNLNAYEEFDRYRFLTPEQRKKWAELCGDPVPNDLLQRCPHVKDSRWRPQIRDGLAKKLPTD